MALAIVLLITVCAGAVRLLTYDRFLPYVDYVDEPTYVALADEIRGYSDQTALRAEYGLLAPLYVYTNVAVQAVHDLFKPHPWHIPGEYFYALRLLSAFFGVCTALAVAWIGWQLAGPAAAVIGGLIWALSPIVVDLNNLAIPDPMLYLVCALALATGIAAWQRRSLRFLTLSLLYGIAAVYLKLWLVTATIPFIVVSIAFALQDRGKVLPRIALLYGIAALFALHFLLALNPFESTVKINANLENGAFFANLVDIRRIANNLWYLVYPTDGGSGISFAVLLAGAVAFVYCRRRGLKAVDGGSLWVLGAYLLATWWLSAGISNVNIDSNGRMRHIFPASVALIPLWAACFVVIVRASKHLLAKYDRIPGWLPRFAASAIVFAVLVGFIRQDVELIAQYSRSYTANQLVQWFDGSPPQEGIVLTVRGSKHEGLWNRLWGAYMGSKPYDGWLMPVDDISLTPPAEFIERDIRWLILSDADFERAEDAQRLQTYVEDLFLVKTIAAEPGQTEGDQYYVYRFELPDRRADYLFGEQIRLIGYDLSSETVRPGDTIQLRPYWRIEGEIQQNLSVFAHLYSAESASTDTPVLLTQWDGEPLPGSNRPTGNWSDVDEVYFGEPYLLTVPPDAASGDYVLAVGLYNYQSQQRLSGADGNTFFTIPLIVSADADPDEPVD